MTPKGKIARLPGNVREELNRRLADGQPAGTILPWLNGLGEVRAVLKRHFRRRPITPQNLSEWRQHGCAQWQAEQAGWAQVRELAGREPVLDADGVAERVMVSSLRLFECEIARLAAEDPGSNGRCRRFEALIDKVVPLIRTHQRQAQQRLDQARERRAQERFEWEETDRRYRFRRWRIMEPLFRPTKVEALAGLIGGDPVEARWLAMQAIEATEDLNPLPPLPDGFDKLPPAEALERWRAIIRSKQDFATESSESPVAGAGPGRSPFVGSTAPARVQPNPAKSNQNTLASPGAPPSASPAHRKSRCSRAASGLEKSSPPAPEARPGVLPQAAAVAAEVPVPVTANPPQAGALPPAVPLAPAAPCPPAASPGPVEPGLAAAAAGVPALPSPRPATVTAPASGFGSCPAVALRDSVNGGRGPNHLDAAAGTAWSAGSRVHARLVAPAVAPPRPASGDIPDASAEIGGS